MTVGFGKRLRESRMRAGLSQREAARRVGLKQPSLSALESGAHGSSGATAELARLYNVNAHWLATGQGLPSLDNNVSPSTIGERKIPLLNYVQAGQFTGMGFDLDISNAEMLLTDLELSSSAFALEIRGSSMLPTFEEGDRVVIDCDISPRPGDYVVAKNDSEEATFKKYRLISTSPEIFELIPLNEDYPTMRSDQHHVEIIGVMVEHRKYRKR
ncbi:LexA family protein [Oligella urethralis]|uniref:LexA family protein n=1 Tax=Oligella urethralis TaxID=90245 RepID=UPI0024302CE5|nr:LexA family transcriptional regulator [Oligella urethralis]